MKKVSVMLLLVGFMAGLIITAPAGAAEKPKKKGGIVSDGKTVRIDYTLTVDGKVIDSTKGGQPVEFKAGAKQMIPGFEKGVMGMKAGQKKSFTVSPEEGYGPFIPNALQETPRKQLPADPEPKVGMTLHAVGNDGRQVTGQIKEVRGDVVVIDFNHPLAGKTLKFDVEVKEIK